MSAAMMRILCGVALLLVGAYVRADERILDYRSDIVIAVDGSMDVTETIRVHAEGKEIQHGIYRDFPTDYRDRGRNRVRIEFTPLDATRDGRPEPFRSERYGNGVRVYLGAADAMLPPGEHRYTLRYRTTRQLGFFADHDELYWNVTGHGWTFPIDQVSAAVTLPGAIPAARIAVEGYTGVQGAKGRDYRGGSDGDSRAWIRGTRALAAKEGLTVVVSFPKGFVTAPSTSERFGWMLGDNRATLTALAGLGVLLLYYLVQWRRLGRDPSRGVVFPQYEPPKNLSPGALRYLDRMGYDDRCFAADVIDLARQGALAIHEKVGRYRLERGRDVQPDRLVGAERELFDCLFKDGAALELVQSEHVRIGGARKAHFEALKKVHKGRDFVTNGWTVFGGVLLSMAILATAVWLMDRIDAQALSGFILVWLAGWSVGVAALGTLVVQRWRGVRKWTGAASAMAVTLFAVPFVVGEVVGLGILVWMSGVAFALTAIAIGLTNAAFLRWMKAPTVQGRRLLDHVEGLKLYLGVAERGDLARQIKKPETIDEFQRLLPHALALDVEKTWADRFAEAVGPSAAAAATRSIGWYHGSTGSFSNLGSFSDGLGASLSNAIASSSSAPGSSSGSGGGGSSGGGGGGGGGGGW